MPGRMETKARQGAAPRWTSDRAVVTIGGWPRRADVAALVGAALVLFVPYGVAGPALFRDDWFTIRNAELDTWWMAAGSAQWTARPVGAAIYALTFGLIGQRPLVHYVLGAAVVTAIAVLLYVDACRFVPRWPALAVAGTWLVLPNHTSLEMWPSAFNIAISLLLFLLALERLTSHPPSTTAIWTGAALLAVGLLAYEAIGPAAVVAVLAIGWTRPADARLRFVLPPLSLLGAAGLWMVANWHPEKKGLETTIDPWFVVPGHFGFSITGDMAIPRAVVPAVVLAVSAIVAYRLIWAERRAGTGWAERAVAVGWVVIVVGTVPFVRYFYSPIGFGDRVTVVSGVGGAVVLVGVGSLLWRWIAPLGAAFVVVLAITMLVQRTSMVAAYATAADDSRRILAAIEDRWPTPPDHTMVFGPEVVDRHVRAFEPMQFPVQVLYGTTDVEVRDEFDVADFERAPREHRFDLRVHSKLDDGRLGSP